MILLFSLFLLLFFLFFYFYLFFLFLHFFFFSWFHLSRLFLNRLRGLFLSATSNEEKTCEEDKSQ
ncbi:MAG: hypothetical protein E3J41_03960 [Candidatus Cloacimonadota bacterium]|nr:MAG: hypothetical protein E3J41_03960 [Candidatus Cloacimonadota bacterium]